jgi:hypothetical protein
LVPTIIGVDTINTPFSDQPWLNRQVLKFLADSSALQEPTSLLAISAVELDSEQFAVGPCR